MPPINRSTNVEAKEYFHSTLIVPLANQGYYVIPPFLSMEILKRESAYDAELFLNSTLSKFGEVFGADIVLFTSARETTFRSGATASRIAQLTVVDCLCVALAQRNWSGTRAALDESRAAVGSRSGRKMVEGNSRRSDQKPSRSRGGK